MREMAAYSTWENTVTQVCCPIASNPSVRGVQMGRDICDSRVLTSRSCNAESHVTLPGYLYNEMDARVSNSTLYPAVGHRHVLGRLAAPAERQQIVFKS